MDGQALERLPRPRVVVLGDLILDHYVWGEVDRISPEAPVPVLKILKEETRPGGAGSVLANLAALEAETRAVSVVGGDAAGDEVLRHLAVRGVDVSGVVRDRARRTTEKTRMIARVQQVLRVDHDVESPLAPVLEDELRARLEEAVLWADVVLISDYGKSVLEGSLARDAARLARARGIPCLADPFRAVDFARYEGSTAITPNRTETELATGVRPDDESRRERAADLLIARLGLEWVAITLDKDGIFLKRRGEPRGRLFPARARAVYDVTGAGDMVLSVLGLVVGGGGDLGLAARLANVASGLEVERLGVSPIARAELLRELGDSAPAALARKIVGEDELLARLAEARRQGKRVVFTNGCFDLLHAGHVRTFELCRTLGDVLVVGLNSDRSVRALKGDARPIVAFDDRATVLAGLAAVDLVVAFDAQTPRELIERVRPDVLVKGQDWEGKEVVGRETVEAAGGRVVLAPLWPGVSTTSIIERVSRLGPSGASLGMTGAE
jgi:D-beta-D-heptose 7-phosphate kinase/D-beta-D-heptose 1-phosphate adenosyltransferase